MRRVSLAPKHQISQIIGPDLGNFSDLRLWRPKDSTLFDGPLRYRLRTAESYQYS